MIDKKNVTYKKAVELIWLYNQRNAFKDEYVEFICQLAAKNEKEKEKNAFKDEGIEFICQLPAKNEKEKGGERE